MAWRRVVKTWSQVAERYYSLYNLVVAERDQRLHEVAITWGESGENTINPYGGFLRPHFVAQVRPTSEQMTKLLHGLARAWCEWRSRGEVYPTLQIEREAVSDGEKADYVIVGERKPTERSWEKPRSEQRTISVKLPGVGGRESFTNGYAYRPMPLGRQKERVKTLSPVLDDAVGVWGFHAYEREPTKATGVSVVCIAPMQVDEPLDAFIMLQKAVELGCPITITFDLHVGLTRRYFYRASLRKLPFGEWVFTYSVVGGDNNWQAECISGFADFGIEIPPEAEVSYREHFVAPPRRSRAAELLKAVGRPIGRVARVVAAGLGLALVPVGVLLVGLSKLAGRFPLLRVIGFGVSGAGSFVVGLPGRLWKPVANYFAETRRQYEEKLVVLTEVVRAAGVEKSNRDWGDACFVGIDPETVRNPQKALAAIKQEKLEAPSQEGDPSQGGKRS